MWSLRCEIASDLRFQLFGAFLRATSKQHSVSRFVKIRLRTQSTSSIWTSNNYLSGTCAMIFTPLWDLRRIVVFSGPNRAMPPGSAMRFESHTPKRAPPNREQYANVLFFHERCRKPLRLHRWVENSFEAHVSWIVWSALALIAAKAKQRIANKGRQLGPVDEALLIVQWDGQTMSRRLVVSLGFVAVLTKIDAIGVSSSSLRWRS